MSVLHAHMANAVIQRVRPTQAGLLVATAAIVLAIIGCGFGCSKPTVKTLVDTVRSTNGLRLIAIDQLELTTRDGRPTPTAVRSAKAIKRLVSPRAIETFTNALATATSGREFRNHPLAIGDAVLRVEAETGTWFIYCRILQTSHGKTCVVEAGPKDETSINQMRSYESDMLPTWLETNQIEFK